MLLLLSNFGRAQIYSGIDELKPYFAELEQLNEQLRSDPRHFTEGYNQLLKISTAKKDSALLSFLYVLQGSYHFYLSSKDSAVYYFDQAALIANQIGNSRIEITAKVRRVFCDEYEKSAPELARQMEEIFKLSLIRNDTINMIYSLNGLGLFYSRMDSTEKSLLCHNWALSLSQSGNHKFEEAFVLNNLGLLKLESGLKDSAYTDFMRGLSISKDLKNDRLECHLRENLGYYYMEHDSFPAAEAEFYYVLKIGEDRGFKDLELSSLTNLAGLARRQENYFRADSLYQQALIIAKAERMFHAVSPIYLGKVQVYTEQQRLSEALSLLDSSLVYAEFSSLLNIRLAYLQLKSSLYEAMGNTQLAFDFYKDFKSLQDSVEENASLERVAEMQLQFNSEKKEKQQLRERNKLVLQLKQQELDMAQFRQRLFFIIAVFVLILSAILIYYYRQKQKSEREFSHTIVNKLEEERGRIARDLHDGIGQSLIILKNKVNKGTDKVMNDHSQIDQNFSDLIEEIRAISRSLIPPELKRLGLKKAIENRLTEVGNTSGLFITTELEDLDKLQTEPHQSLRIYRIIQELTTNTIKHSEATALKIEAILDDNELTIIYQDNGKGFDKEKWKSSDSSVGLRSIQQRLNYLNGTIKFEKPKKGFKAVMKIELK